MLNSPIRPCCFYFSMKMEQELYLKKQIALNQHHKICYKMTQTHYLFLVSWSKLIPNIHLWALYISNQVKDPGHPFLDEQNCNVYFISRWILSTTHKWVFLSDFLSKTYIHAYCYFVLEKENSLVSNCTFPRAFPLIWLWNSHFQTCRMLPRKPGMVVSHSIFYLSQAKAAKNPLKQ